MDEDTPAAHPSQAPRLVAREDADEEAADVAVAEPPKAAPKEVEPSPEKPREVAPARLDRTTEDDLLATQTFFSQPPSDHAGESWDTPTPAMPVSSRRAMYAAVSIFSVSLLLLCGYLIYTRLLMPVPAQLGTGPGMPAAVALPPTAHAEPTAHAQAPAPAPAPAVAAAAPVQAAAPAPVAAAAPATAVPAPVTLEPAPAAAPAAAAPVAPAATAVAEAPAAPAPAAPAAAPAEPAAIAVAPPAAPTGQVAELLQSADALYKRNKYKQARTAYEQVLAVDPNAPGALSRMAFLDLQAGDNERAKQFASRAVEVDPTSSEGWIVLGAALESLRDRTGARAAYAKCSELGTGPYLHECKKLAH